MTEHQKFGLQVSCGVDAPAADTLPVFCAAPYGKFLQEHRNGGSLVVFSSVEDQIVMPLRIMRGRLLSTAQPLFAPVRADRALTLQEETQFLRRLLDCLTEMGIDRVITPPTHCVFQTSPSRAHSCRFGSFVIDLKLDEDTLLARMHKDHRTEIRQGLRRGVTVSFDADLATFYEMYRQTTERAGIYREPIETFQAMQRTLGAEGRMTCAVAHDANGTPMGGALVLHSRYSGYYSYGASIPNIPVAGAIKALHWQIMRFLKARGVDRYDFVGARMSSVQGTPLEGVQRFKGRFGGNLNEGWLWKLDLNPPRTSIADTLNTVRRILRRLPPPAPDVIDQEEYVEKNHALCTVRGVGL